jgi:hypothetical protein
MAKLCQNQPPRTLIKLLELNPGNARNDRDWKTSPGGNSVPRTLLKNAKQRGDEEEPCN